MDDKSSINVGGNVGNMATGDHAIAEKREYNAGRIQVAEHVHGTNVHAMDQATVNTGANAQVKGGDKFETVHGPVVTGQARVQGPVVGRDVGGQATVATHATGTTATASSVKDIIVEYKDKGNAKAEEVEVDDNGEVLLQDLKQICSSATGLAVVNPKTGLVKRLRVNAGKSAIQPPKDGWKEGVRYQITTNND